MITTDVVVVGGGPAGSTAATVLARAGRSVIVVDKAAFPRDKCCGDGLTTLALRELETLGLRPERVPHWKTVTDTWLRAPSGRLVHLPMPAEGIFAATTPRRELDAALLQLAGDAGARVLDAHAVVDVRPAVDHVEVDVGGAGPIAARYVVAADGMWSPTRKALGLAEPGYLGEWHAFRQYAHGVTGPARDGLYVWFERDLLPGYAWSFPLPDGRVNIGFGVLRDGVRKGREMSALWDELLRRPHIAGALGDGVELEGRHTAWPIPAAIDRSVLAAGRVLFVGDAARATDVLTGEGIGQALVTGRLAAEAIVAGGAEAVDPVARGYDREARRHLLADHRMSKVLNGVLRHRRAANGALALADLNDWTRRRFVRWMFEDEPRAVGVTPRRWHRHLFNRVGPYTGAV